MPFSRSKSAGHVIIAGSFAPAGTGAPTAAKGAAYTVARTGVGLFTLTLSKIYQDVLSVSLTAQSVTAALFQVEAGAISVSSKTIIIRTLVAGVPADVAADANNRVNFTVHLKDSAARP